MKEKEKELREEITTALEIVEEDIKSKEDGKFLDGAQKTNAILVRCNAISKILSNALEAAEVKTGYDVYLQRNVCPIEKAGFTDYDDYKAYFDYFCAFYNSKNYNSIHDIKRLVNYSKAKPEEVFFMDYPVETKMILVVENFNFWSRNSQLGLVRLSQNPNIMVIGQIRTDFDFAVKHIDIEASDSCSHIELDV
ncbi:MAG: hypothetical protein K0B11_02795 [Mariniphaga sp.]|nr:hypothetical protein [Mariniphaga sp.]